MDAVEAPIPPSGFALFLIDNGWRWGHDMLRGAVEWLAQQDITDSLSLEGLAFGDLTGIDEWDPEV